MTVYIHPQPADGCMYGPYLAVNMDASKVTCQTLTGTWLTMFHKGPEGWRPCHYRDKVYNNLHVEHKEGVSL